MRRLVKRIPAKWAELNTARRGVFLVLGAVCMVAAMAFMAMAVDLGMASLTRAQMQSACDAAALSAALTLTNSYQTASGQSNPFTYAQAQAQAQAANVAQLNNVYVNPSTDVTFGQYTLNSNNTYTINWSASANQTNVVQVQARRNSTDSSSPNAVVPSLFGGLTGGTSLVTSSIAVVNPRDLVIVQDFSRSMNFDSYFTSDVTTGMTAAQVETALSMVWSDLQPLTLGTMTYNPQYFSQSESSSGVTGTVTFMGPSVSVTSTTGLKSVKLTFSSGSQTISVSGTTTKSGTYSGTGSYSGKSVTSVSLTSFQVGSTSKTVTLPTHSYTSTNVMAAFGLTNSNYPYPGGTWSGYISYVQAGGALTAPGYNDMYGGLTWLCYQMEDYPSFNQCQDFWKTRHYPFQACKDGQTMFCSYLESLGFGDNLGMVSYDSNHRIETTISVAGFPSVNLSATPMSQNYSAVQQLMYYKQAAYYSDATNMAGGMSDALTLLQNYGRPGATPAIILMTDGVANTVDSGAQTTLPAGWNWNTMFDYNGDGVADYSTTNPDEIAVFVLVQQAVNNGYTVHTVSVGSVANRPMMQAIAWLGNGYWLDVPAGTTVASMSTQMEQVFAQIAADVPPPKLITTGP